MADWANLDFSPSMPEAKEAAERRKREDARVRRWSDMAVTGEIELPPVVPTASPSIGANFRAALVDDPATKRRLFAESLGVPVEQMAMTPTGGIAVNRGDYLEQVDTGFRAGAGKFLAHTPEIVGAGIGAAVTAPAGGWGGAILGPALGGMAGLAGRKIYANQALDEPQDPLQNAKDLAWEGTWNAIFGAGGKAFNAIRGQRAVSQIANLDIPALDARRAAVKAATGIDLDLAQLSGSKTLAEWRDFVTHMPGESSEIMLAFDKLQRGQTTQAVESLTQALSPRVASYGLQGAKGRNAAKMIIDLAEETRNTAVRPFYEATAKVNLSGDVYETLLKDPVLKAELRRVRTLPAYRKELEGLPDTSVKVWHYVSQSLGDRIADAGAKRNLARIYAGTKDDLTKALTAASPEYKLAQEFYADVTANTVTPLRESIVGTLAELQNPQIRNAAKQIFDGGPLPSVDSIAFARKEFMALEAKNPEMAGAWNGLVSQWMKRNLEMASRVNTQGEVVNVAGRFFQRVAGTESQRKALNEAFGPGSDKLLKDVLDAIEMAAKTPMRNSPTALRQETANQLTGRTVSNVVSAVRSPFQTAVQALDERNLARHSVEVAQALTDPTKRKLLDNLRQLTPGQKRAALMTSVIFGQTLGTTGNVALNP